MGNSNEYMNEYMKRRYKQRKEKAILLLGGKCLECGTTEDLQFDHINPDEKSFNISKMWSISEARFLKELSKCQLLCELHHLNKTLGEISVPHGGGLTGKRNCYCDLCKPLKQLYNREWRALNW